jgi:NAD(P) transhydrogenase subunit beta
MLQAALGMVLAIIGTLIQQEIIEYQWIIGGLIVGSLLGYPLGMWVPMTAMPQRIAFSHMFGALAATLVGVAEFTTALRDGEIIAVSHMTALGIEVLFGALTVTGSFIAFGKLAEILPGRPITYKGQNYVNLVLFVVTLGFLIYVIVEPEAQWAFFTLVGLSAAIGLFIVLPIGGADLPGVISLLTA